MDCIANVKGNARCQPAFTSVVADSGSMTISAMSFVATMESAAVVATRAITTHRIVLRCSSTMRAMRSNAPMSRNAFATASTLNKQQMAFQSMYPR